MWIRALSVKHFAGIRSADLEFVNGLNVLHGPNEIGKSTLVTAIRAVLLLQDGATAAESFEDWHTDQPPQANLTFEVEPQRIWRIRKSFGKGAEGSSYLEFSRDGTDFTQEAKGREVDGKIRDTLQWGLDRPGGKGKKKGFGESFLSTTLLAEQDAVKEVLNRGLDDDPDESGKQHLVDALQALAQDPVFTRVLAATQEKVNEAYTSTGQKSRRRGSPWMELRTQRQAAEKRRADIGSQARSSESARQQVEELRHALNEAQSHLDVREGRRAKLEIAWRQQQAREDVHAEIVAATAERDRIQALHDQLVEVTTAREAAEAVVQSAKTALERSTGEQEATAETLHGARERLSGLESSSTEQARRIRRQEIDKRLLENENRQRAVEQRRNEAASVSALQDKTAELRADVDAKSGAFAQGEALVETAIHQNQVDNDAISGTEEALQAVQLLAARRDHHRARDSAREAAKLEAEVAACREQARKIRDDLAQLGLPGVQEVESLSTLETRLLVAEGKLRVGISVDIRPRRQITARIGTDDAPFQDAVLTEPASLDATSRLQLTLDDVADIDIRGGSSDARREAEALRQNWHERTVEIFGRLGVTQLSQVREMQRDCDRRREQAEALERDAQTAADRAKTSAAAGAAGEALDRTVVRLEHRMVSVLSSENDLEEVLRRYESADELDEAVLEDRLKALRETLETKKKQVGALERQLAKDKGVLETKEQEVVSLEGELSQASDTLGAPCTEVLQQTVTELETLAAQRQEKQQALESIERDQTSEVERAQDVVAAAAAAMANAEMSTKKWTMQAEEAQGTLDRLTGEVSTRQEVADREDLPAALATLAGLQSKLEAIPKQETEVAEADRLEADRLVRDTADQRDQLQSELQKAEGALQQVGGHAIQEKLEQAEEAVQVIDRREHELDLDYGAWQLLRDTLQEAEAADAVHLGKALIEPVTTRMAALTDGRYGDLVIGPKLQTESIEVAGTQRDLTELSVGMQEQLATVLRLTIADAIGSTIVLDDQLVQSDGSRMEWLRIFMMECATRFQILVFTCRPEEYEPAETEEETAFASIDLAKCLQRSS